MGTARSNAEEFESQMSTASNTLRGELEVLRDNLTVLENDVRSGLYDVSPDDAAAIRRAIARSAEIMGAITDAGRVQLEKLGAGSDPYDIAMYHQLHEELCRLSRNNDGSPRHQTS